MECLKFAFLLQYDIHNSWVSNHTIRTVKPKYNEDELSTVCRLQNRIMELKKGISN